MADTFPMIAKTFFGLEPVLAEELAELGAQDIAPGRRMVSFVGDRRLLYRANLWCRTAVRILKPIAGFSADSEQALYRGVRETDWSQHLDAAGSLAIDPVVHGSIHKNSLFAAQLAKDAIVDQFRERFGARPAVDLAEPDLRINLHINQDQATIYLDASGDSLHKRGYRTAAGEAPLNEVLAAGILRLTGWNRQSPLADFMCGSGTIPIEAALWARNIAPGLVRREFGTMKWPDFNAALHAELLAEARQARRDTLPFAIQASDIDPRMIEAARANARQAGVEHDIHFAVANFEAAAPLVPGGILVTNPPYDERLKAARIAAVYRRIGDVLKRRWSGSTAFIFTGNLEAARQIGLRTAQKIRLFNGPIECRLLKFPLYASAATTDADDKRSGQRAEAEPDATDAAPRATAAETTPRDHAEAFRNRLGRMAKHWSKWARRQGITCYRLYDRDVPDVPLTIDWIEGHLLLAEHDRPHDRTEIEQQAWLDEMAGVAAATLSVPAERVHWRKRRRLETKPPPRHKSNRPELLIEARERGQRFLVDLSSRSSPGLPLDQRTLRSMIAKEAAGKRFLNLFAGAATMTVAAAAGGAAATITVEPASVWAERARQNVQLNGLTQDAHQLDQSEPLELLGELSDRVPPFDLIFVNPPAPPLKVRQSRGGLHEVRRGYVELLNLALGRLAAGGKIYFVTTARRVKLHESDFPGATLREITRQTIPPDFRDKRVHRCWVLKRG